MEEAEIGGGVDVDFVAEFFEHAKRNTTLFPLISHVRPMVGKIGVEEGEPGELCAIGVGGGEGELDVFFSEVSEMWRDLFSDEVAAEGFNDEEVNVRKRFCLVIGESSRFVSRRGEFCF